MISYTLLSDLYDKISKLIIMISKIHQLLTSPSLTSFPLSKQPKFKFSSSPPPPPPPSKYPKKKQPHVNPPI
jgi:hypothetical protein